MNLAQLTGENAQLLRRLEDLNRMAENGSRPRFSAFLSEGECAVAEAFLRQRGGDCGRLFGGYQGALRCVFGAFAPFLQPEDAAFPITALTLHFPKGAGPTHRDVLGSLMSLGLKRESVGDLLIDHNRCDLFALDTVAPLLLDELRKIGGWGVRCEIAQAGEIVRKESFSAGRGTVSTPRMDAVVSVLTGLSREKSAGLIRTGLVRRNHRPCEGVADQAGPDDVISIRGYGKYIVDEIGSPTKKGRLPLLYRKFQ